MKEHSENLFLMQLFFTNRSPKIFYKTYHDLVLQLSALVEWTTLSEHRTWRLESHLFMPQTSEVPNWMRWFFFVFSLYVACVVLLGMLDNNCPVTQVGFVVFLNLLIFLCIFSLSCVFFSPTFSTHLPTLNSVLVFASFSLKPMKCKFHWNQWVKGICWTRFHEQG